MSLTKAQHLVLTLASTDLVEGSNTTDPLRGLVPTRVADRLVQRGLLSSNSWNGRTWTYRITPAGRAALAETESA